MESNIHPTHGNGTGALSTEPVALAPRLTLLLAAVAGLGVAALYYTQPMLAIIGADLHASPALVGAVPMLTQLGYALGIFLLAPLGDRIDRRRIILTKAAVLTGALVISAAAPNITVLLVASFAIGLTATLAQDVVPSAAMLAPEHHRGRVVGSVMTGLLLGILLSRVVSGLVAERFGWRVMLAGAAVGMAIALAVTARGLPSIRTTTRMPYRDLLKSLGSLWRRHGALRRASIAQGLLAMGFSAFWSTLALMLSGNTFHLGSGVAGAFGLAGAVGALAAPIAGRLADKRGPEWVTRAGVGLAVASFAMMTAATLLTPRAQLALIAITVVGFDLGVQATLIAHQTIIYGIDPEARSRLNAVLFTVMFIGMAAGAGIGSVLLELAGWVGVTLFAVVTSASALAVRLSAANRQVGTRQGETVIVEG